MAGRRMSQEINAGSMADIAFLLLVFFLVTTTMDSDWGLARLLPPPPEDIPQNDDIKIKERDVFVVLANANDQLLVEGELLEIDQLREKAKEFITNASHSENLPQWEDISLGLCNQKIAEAKAAQDKDVLSKWKKRLEAANVLGNYTLTKQVISLQNDRGTSYNLYIQVQNELAAAYRELREELAREKLGEDYAMIEEKAKSKNPVYPDYKEKYNAIKTVYPQRISEAEPKEVGQN